MTACGNGAGKKQDTPEGWQLAESSTAEADSVPEADSGETSDNVSREDGTSGEASMSEETGTSEGNSDESGESENSEPADGAEQAEKSGSSEETENGESSADETVTDPEEICIETILSGMTVEEKVGQMIMGRYPSGEDGAALAAEYHLGGYVFFDADFAGWSEEEVILRNDGIQETAQIPLLLSVDEEGGSVTRVSDYFRDSRFSSPRYLYSEGGWDAVEAETAEKCELLLRLHLNMNLAPVADLSDDPEDFMYYRAFSGDPELTAEFVRRTVTIMNGYGVACSLKHFPGYGNNLDTHVGMSVDSRDLSEFYDRDLTAFRAGAEAGAGTIMVSHNIVECFDAELPASLSPAVHEAARELGFDGVLITDDLAMDAIAEYYGMEEAAVMAVQAGNDMLITSSFEVQYHAILNAVDSGEITEERLDESVRRILRLKYSMGLIG